MACLFGMASTATVLRLNPHPLFIKMGLRDGLATQNEDFSSPPPGRSGCGPSTLPAGETDLWVDEQDPGLPFTAVLFVGRVTSACSIPDRDISTPVVVKKDLWNESLLAESPGIPLVIEWALDPGVGDLFRNQDQHGDQQRDGHDV